MSFMLRHYKVGGNGEISLDGVQQASIWLAGPAPMLRRYATASISRLGIRRVGIPNLPSWSRLRFGESKPMKYAIVTGGARGLGMGIVNALLADQVVEHVAIIDRD